MQDCKPVHLFVSPAPEKGEPVASDPATAIKAEPGDVCLLEASEARIAAKPANPADAQGTIGAEEAVSGRGPRPWVLDICLVSVKTDYASAVDMMFGICLPDIEQAIRFANRNTD